MAYGIEDMACMDPNAREALLRQRVRTTGELLAACADPVRRRWLASVTEIQEDDLLRWASIADLMRIHGIGQQFAEMLQAAGIHTVSDLARQNPERLCVSLGEVNADRRYSRTSPGRVLCADWIDQASTARRVLDH